ncbi:MAG: DUF3180 domain-containing protein [Pseudolysinimonas sp.]
MTRTRPATLVVLAVIGAVVGFLLQIALAAASAPKFRPEFTFGATLALIGIVVVVLAVPVYRATHGPVRQPVDSFYATRVVVLGKSSSLAGALLSGLGIGLVIEVLTHSGTTTTEAVLRVLATLGGAVLLLAGGLVAEFLCRVPQNDDDDDHPDNGPERAHL